MKTVLRTLRGGTRNQSTADYQRRQVFISGNRNQKAVFNNNTGDDLTAESGILVVRNTTSNKIQPAADDGSDLAAVIGVLHIDGEVVLSDGDDLNVNYTINGDVDSGELILPGVTTLQTTVGNKNLADILTSLGFVLHNVTENSKFDN